MGRSSSPTHSFRIGERVRLVAPYAGVPAETIGTVVGQFAGGPLCGVQFNGIIGVRLVEGRKLASAPLQPVRRRT
jgi:hypothetical protein